MHENLPWPNNELHQLTQHVVDTSIQNFHTPQINMLKPFHLELLNLT